MLAGQSQSIARLLQVAMSRGALLLVALQLLLSSASCQNDSAALLSQDTSFSNYEGEKMYMNNLTDSDSILYLF